MTENLVEIVEITKSENGINKNISYLKLEPLILYLYSNGTGSIEFSLINSIDQNGFKFVAKFQNIELKKLTKKEIEESIELLELFQERQEEYLINNKSEKIFNISASQEGENINFAGQEYSFKEKLEVQELDYQDSMIHFVLFTIANLPLFHNLSILYFGDDEEEQKLLIADNHLSIKNLLGKTENITKEEFDPYLEEILGLLLYDVNFISKELSEEAEINRPFKQHDYKSPASLSYPMQKVITKIYSPKLYSDEDLEIGYIDVNVNITKRNDPNNIKVLNRIFLQTDKRLNYFDYLTFSAYYTLVDRYKNEYITYLDIANTIHKTQSGKQLESKDRFVEEVRKSITKQRSVLVGDFDFSQEAEHYPKEGLKELLEAGGTRIANFNLIFATEIEFIEKHNGAILKGLAPAGGTESERIHKTLFAYINANSQIKTLPNEYLINPLNASVDNEMIFHYMINKLSAMPYKGKEKYLLTDNETNEPRSYKNKDWENSINIDTLIEELNFDIKQKSRYTKRIERILDFWKSKGFIINYDIQKKGRSKQSYLLSID